MKKERKRSGKGGVEKEKRRQKSYDNTNSFFVMKGNKKLVTQRFRLSYKFKHKNFRQWVDIDKVIPFMSRKSKLLLLITKKINK
jgi:hypothetical protein